MQRALTWIFLVLTLVALASPTLAVDVEPQKKADINQLMEMTGSKDIGMQFGRVMTRQIYQMVKASNPEIPDRALGIIEEETTSLINSESDSLFEKLIPVYDKHFSAEEIKQLMAFYQTALGKKTIEVMPLVMQESMSVGQAWGQNLGPKLMAQLDQRFKAEKIDLKH